MLCIFFNMQKLCMYVLQRILYNYKYFYRILHVYFIIFGYAYYENLYHFC